MSCPINKCGFSAQGKGCGKALKQAILCRIAKGRIITWDWATALLLRALREWAQSPTAALQPLAICPIFPADCALPSAIVPTLNHTYLWDRTLICIDLVKGLGTWLGHGDVFYPSGTSGSERGGLRRLPVTLIFVGWVPPDLTSSRNCLTLGAGFGAPGRASPIVSTRVFPRWPATLRFRCAVL